MEVYEVWGCNNPILLRLSKIVILQTELLLLIDFARFYELIVFGVAEALAKSVWSQKQHKIQFLPTVASYES